jgi:hypothetical protein
MHSTDITGVSCGLKPGRANVFRCTARKRTSDLRVNRTVGVKVIVLNASTEPELKEAFSQAVQQRADALLVHIDALFNDHVEQIVALALQHGLPTMSAVPRFPALDGLVSYGADTLDLQRQAGIYDCKRLLCGTLHFLLPGGSHPHRTGVGDTRE